ncbi:MAG: type II toxin-antitoxin system RelE/ParE family toxin [Candidatus Caccosoma sp.]|nr:type II toxin-antitoxin system RelE/ParE family toxin [Candidatus Caccosoma sp.]
MNITYKNKKMHKICTDASIAAKTYGSEMALKIAMRVDQIQATDSIEVLVQNKIGRCHQLRGNRKNEYAMDLVHPYRLVFKIDEFNNIQIAFIMEIIDYH